MKYYLTIDPGTSVIKTVIFYTNFKQVNSYSIKNLVITDELGKTLKLGKYFVSGLTEGAIK